MLTTELIQSVLESAPDAMVIADEAGQIIFVNQQVTALFGYPADGLLHQDVECLLPDRFRGRHVAHRERFATDGRVRPMGLGLELFARREDGSEFPVEISLSPIRDGDRTLVAAAIRDVTDRKRIQSELVAAREAADRANQAKSRFLATASHDLRQPLQALALLNGTLQRTIAERVAAEAVEQQERAIASMSQLLNALLDISKIEAGVVKPEPSDFGIPSLFEELRGQFADVAASKGLHLQVEPSPDSVRSDRSLIAQILRNLIANAIKFTHTGSVCLRCLPEGPKVRIQVLDTGVGIAAEQLPLIYDEFYQIGVGPNSVREGYGLGLSIVQRLVTLLGLTLEVRSEPGRGSVFSLAVPASTARSSATGIADSAGAEERRGAHGHSHVLVIDDDPAVLSATRMLLRVEGYRVTTSSSLADALEKVRASGDVDFVIADYHLGDGKTGREAVSAVRAVLGPGLRAVLLTGDTSSAMKELACDVSLPTISKPINADDLLALLRQPATT